ncbi:MAG: iron ABC transporter permease [Bacteroidales bacterium]|nr:iron ABC transporter permease [Bacteroidales bacterium]
MMWGSVRISFTEIISVFRGTSSNSAWQYIVLEYRIPKALTAIFTGAALSVCGLMMQTLFRNPLAGPYVLGVSSGASLGVALFIMAGALIPGFMLIGILGSWGFVLSAVIGALLVMSIVMVVSFKVQDAVSLLIVGIMFGSITASIVSILQYFSDPQQVHNFLMWTFGSLSSCTWDEIIITSIFFFPTLIIAFFSSKPLNALLLGENYAKGLGVNIKKTRIIVIITTSLLTGTITAFTKLWVLIVNGRNEERVHRPAKRYWAPAAAPRGAANARGGADWKHTLPINSVTALFGAPVVILVIFRSRNFKYKF